MAPFNLALVILCSASRFEPELLLACGSPIGMFMALRAGFLDKENLFKFKTTKRFYNVFHVSLSFVRAVQRLKEGTVSSRYLATTITTLLYMRRRFDISQRGYMSSQPLLR